MKRKGKLTGNSKYLRPHEMSVVKYLLDRGYDVGIIPPPRKDHVSTPDIVFDGAPWEMKTLYKSNHRALERAFRKAVTQADHIIFDLRYLETRTDDKQIKLLLALFVKTSTAKKLAVIRKNNRLIFQAK